ncbi:MAG: ferritin family protein [Sedimentisphaerales bacterium]
MKPFSILDDIFDFAIDNEIEAYKFYTDLAAKANNPEMRQVFLDFAAEEQGHRKLLEDAKKGKKVKIGSEKISDLKIADYAVDVKPTPNMAYKDALILAMKKEKASFALYTDLAAVTQDSAGKKLFTSLAQQEAKHKLRFELEYDGIVLKED